MPEPRIKAVISTKEIPVTKMEKRDVVTVTDIPYQVAVSLRSLFNMVRERNNGETYAIDIEEMDVALENAGVPLVKNYYRFYVSATVPVDDKQPIKAIARERER